VHGDGLQRQKNLVTQLRLTVLYSAVNLPAEMNLEVNFKIIQENQINEQHLYLKSGDVLHREPLQT